MPGSINITIGNATSSVTLSATNTKILSGVRDAARGLGHPGDAGADSGAEVSGWLVRHLARYIREASKGVRVEAAMSAARDAELDEQDPFEENP